MNPVDGDQVYAAERLLQMRTRSGKSEYLVKWKGWSTKHNTWEPVENILDERLIHEFEQRKGSSVSRTSKRKSTTAIEKPKEEATPTPAKKGRRASERETSTPTPSTSLTTRSGRPIRTSQMKIESGESRESSVKAPLEMDSEDAKESEPEPEKEKEPIKEKEGGSTDSIKSKEKDGNIDKEKSAEVAKEKSAEPAKEKISETNKEKSGEADKQKNGEIREEKVAEGKKGSITDVDSSTEDNSKSVLVSEAVKDASNTSPISEKVNSTPNKTLNAPLEIFVEKDSKKSQNGKNETGEKPEAKQSSSNNTKNDDAYIITNQSDPKCTHKIQMMFINSTPEASSSGKSTPIKNGTADIVVKRSSNDNSNANPERIETTVKNSAFDTKVWTDIHAQNSQEPIDFYQYCSSNTITEVTVDGKSVTFLEI